ncbi:TniQ family protein [Deinococcus planocerae]|uniref:TniQ family protein n=1 Tax=Deinococcus planocerae TaxID=1737569 RepID=UPI000C7F204A|nr:TniQ family protein [Deinococcus planocerae]
MTGGLLRPLPSRPWPLGADGPEAFASYVERSGALQLLPVAVSTLLTRSGVISEDRQGALPSGYGVDLTDAQVASFARVHDLPETVVRGMLLRRYDGVAFELSGLDVTDARSVRRVAHREWANFTGSAYCPGCLAHQAAWKLEWKLWFSVLCPIHQTLLVDICPRCGRRPGNYRSDAGGMPRYATRPVQLGVCLNPPAPGLGGEGRSSVPCGHVLVDTPALDLSDAPHLLQAQETVLAALRAREGVFLGEQLRALDAFNHLRSLTALLLHVAQPEDLGSLPPGLLAAFQEHARERDLTRTREQGRRGTSIHPYKAPPATLRLTAAVLPLATEILKQGSAEALDALLIPVLRRAQDVKGGHVRQLADYFHIEGPLLSAFDRRLAGTASFERRLGRRALVGSLVTYPFTPAEVPQLLWEGEYQAHFAPLFAASTLSISFARRVCSMALVRLCGPYTWAQAADALSLPASHATGVANRAMGLLAVGGHDAPFREALHALAQRLSLAPHRVNYRVRRERLATFHTLSTADWHTLAGSAGLLGVKDAARRRNAAAWVWAQVTSGDAGLSPALNQSGEHRASRMEMYRRFCQQDLPTLRAGLMSLVRVLEVQP